ncbi:alpha/beta fold hydrolase [Nocardioides zeae]|uniref:Alpha/beta hydrolase n=1 Tax=Nocardioides zeae TaxID=1457234 RepID=A0A6P0HM75_9ACTN|nr:alpha/beta hydrolase [Nocardioides zeae]NEN79721.1 alpha/beta hydrolase [Nocardioides zeae]
MALTAEGIIEVPGMSSLWARLGNGAKAHYMFAGEDGPAVVLLHGGLPGSSGAAGWRFTATALAEAGFRVYCPDMPGFGLSDPAEQYRPRGLHDHVDFIQDFVDAVGLDTFHIAGNSMGCMNTVSYVTAHPERVRSYILIAGDIGDIVDDQEKPRGRLDLSFYDGSREGMRKMMAAILHRPETVSEDLVEMRYQAASRHAEGYKILLPNIHAFANFAEWSDPNLKARMSTKGRFDQMTIPGLYLYGRQDILTPVEWGYVQEDRLPNVQFFYPDDCGHQGQTDRPDLFNPVFVEFFRDGQVSRATADAAGVSDRRPEISAYVAPA